MECKWTGHLDQTEVVGEYEDVFLHYLDQLIIEFLASYILILRDDHLGFFHDLAETLLVGLFASLHRLLMRRTQEVDKNLVACKRVTCSNHRTCRKRRDEFCPDREKKREEFISQICTKFWSHDVPFYHEMFEDICNCLQMSQILLGRLEILLL